jgi:cytochrome b561
MLDMEEYAVTRYSAFGQALHWVMAVLILITFIYGPGGGEKHVYSTARDFDRQLHETLGLIVVTLTLVRVAWRAAAVMPAVPSFAPRWTEIASKGVRLGIYLLFFALPLTSVAGAWLEGHPLTMLGNIQIEPQLTKSHELGTTIAEIHTWLGDAIMWLAGLHVLAALFHHFILRDGVLVSMLPR